MSLFSSDFPGKLGGALDRIWQRIQRDQVVAGHGLRLEETPNGTAVHLVNSPPPAALPHLRRLFVRHIGIDCMWVSESPGGIFANYWYQADADTELHYYCLKPFQLQNAWWWDEVAAEGRFNAAFGITDGPSPQTGLLTVQSVGGETYDLGTGSFDGLTTRVLHDEPVTPPEIYQAISPQLVTDGWDFGDTNYGGTTNLWAQRIPKGLFVCDEKGKVVWDHLSGLAKPATLGTVATWAIDDPDGPGGGVSVPKEGNYDVEFIDLNVDGRHWATVDSTP